MRNRPPACSWGNFPLPHSHTQNTIIWRKRNCWQLESRKKGGREEEEIGILKHGTLQNSTRHQPYRHPCCCCPCYITTLIAHHHWTSWICPNPWSFTWSFVRLADKLQFSHRPICLLPAYSMVFFFKHKKRLLIHSKARRDHWDHLIWPPVYTSYRTSPN